MAACCESPPAFPSDTSRPASRFSSAKVPAMGVDDASLGDLAEPRKRLAVLEFGRIQGANRLDADLLKNVFDLEPPPQPGAELPLDKGQQRFAAFSEKLGQGRDVVRLDLRFTRFSSSIPTIVPAASRPVELLRPCSSGRPFRFRCQCNSCTRPNKATHFAAAAV